MQSQRSKNDHPFRETVLGLSTVRESRRPPPRAGGRFAAAARRRTHRRAALAMLDATARAIAIAPTSRARRAATRARATTTRAEGPRARRTGGGETNPRDERETRDARGGLTRARATKTRARTVRRATGEDADAPRGDGDDEQRGMERAGDVAEPGSGVELHNAELARGTSGDKARAREPWE